jgi:hypothetical protein
MQNENIAAAHMDLFFIIFGGMVAVSCFQNWMTMKMAIRTPKKQNRRIIRQELHSYLVPPHCRASKRQITAGMKKTVPRRSNSFMRAFHPRLATAARSGALKKIRITIIAIAPIGRLIKKHQRHVATNC